MYKIAICDDDKRYRKTIREIIEHENSLPENEIRFYEYESGNELLKHTDILHELVFIDIRMPGLDGNQTALKLRNYNKDAVLIFYSSYFEPTVDSINFGQPFRYIMKDLHDTSLRREIAAIMTEVKRRFLNDYAVTVTSAGKAEGWEWSALLTEMMQTPTIKGIAEKIEAFQKDTDYVIDPCLVQLKKSVKENSQSVAKVLFHAGTGTLTPYNALLSYIEKDSKENEAIIGFTFGDDADYISMETSQTFRLLGEKYGKILNKLGYSNYILIGHCVGGLIALETAQYLQKKNVQVSDVTLISSNIPKQKNQTILSQATDEIYRKTLQSSLDNEILLERIFAKLIGADAYKAGYQVDEERLQQYIEYIVDQGTGDITVEALCNTGGKFEDVAKEFRLLASKSVSERLNALYNIIERPNGELMEHQLKMLNILFRVFSQNFRCVSTYEPKPYYGNMRILCCEIQGGHFYPGFFAEDYETWKPYAKGNLTFDLIKGWHLDCITEPNLGENIKKMLDFNY